MSTVARSVSKLANRRVLVLGGTSGIGFCVAQVALELGATVFVSSSNSEKVKSAVHRLKSSQPENAPRISGFPCDLASKDRLESNLDNLLASITAAAPLNHICFTAGDSIKFSSLKDITLDDVDKTQLVRFMGPIMLAKLSTKYLVKEAASSITLTSGSISWKPPPNAAVVTALSSSIEGLGRGLAKELRPARVNVVSPGAILTEHFDGIPPDKLKDLLDQWRKETTVNEIGKPEEVADAYLYSMTSAFVTGAVLDCNGGRFLT